MLGRPWRRGGCRIAELRRHNRAVNEGGDIQLKDQTERGNGRKKSPGGGETVSGYLIMLEREMKGKKRIPRSAIRKCSNRRRGHFQTRGQRRSGDRIAPVPDGGKNRAGGAGARCSERKKVFERTQIRSSLWGKACGNIYGRLRLPRGVGNAAVAGKGFDRRGTRNYPACVGRRGGSCGSLLFGGGGGAQVHSCSALEEKRRSPASSSGAEFLAQRKNRLACDVEACWWRGESPGVGGSVAICGGADKYPRGRGRPAMGENLGGGGC